MSLINDVLRDLERRQGKEVGKSDSVTTSALPQTARRTWWPWLAGAVVVGVLAQVGYMVWPTQQAEPYLPPIAAAESQPVLLANVEPKTAFLQDLSTSTGSIPQPQYDTPAAPETIENPANEPLVELRPSDDEGTQRAIAASQIERASAPTDPVAVAAPAPEPVTQTTSAPNPAARIEIQRAATISDDPVDQALRAISRGQFGLAQSHLNDHLAEQPGDVRARLLSAEVLVSQQRPGAARQLLETGLDPASAQDIAPALARLLQSDDPVQARQILLRHPPEPSGARDYHLLLAALHRQVGAHDEAADLYRRLTEINPDHAVAWVGLGSSLESLGEPEKARSAYQTAAIVDDARLGAFARQRLAALAVDGEQP